MPWMWSTDNLMVFLGYLLDVMKEMLSKLFKNIRKMINVPWWICNNP